MISFVLHNGNLPKLIEYLQRLDVTKKFSVEIKPFKAKRSYEQNKRYWLLMTQLGKHLGYTQDELHDIARYKFLRNAIEIDGERLPLLQTTTKLTTAQMADYQDSIEKWAHGFGFFFQE